MSEQSDKSDEYPNISLCWQMCWQIHLVVVSKGHLSQHSPVLPMCSFVINIVINWLNNIQWIRPLDWLVKSFSFLPFIGPILVSVGHRFVETFLNSWGCALSNVMLWHCLAEKEATKQVSCYSQYHQTNLDIIEKFSQQKEIRNHILISSIHTNMYFVIGWKSQSGVIRIILLSGVDMNYCA